MGVYRGLVLGIDKPPYTAHCTLLVLMGAIND